MRIENVQMLTGGGTFKNGSIEFGDKIQKIETHDAICPGAGPYLIPGLIDIHTHGALGRDHSDGSAEKMRGMSIFYAKAGVTSFLATTLTSTEGRLARAMRNAAQFVRPPGGARCAGINMEGPFFSYEKRGAHPADLLMPPDVPMFERLYKLSGGKIKLVSISPELGGAMEFIRRVSQVSRVSLAHSAADYGTAMEAFGNGAAHVTHLFNGMNPFMHREPGIIGAALDAGASVELICDGYHLHPAVVRAVFGLFPDGVCMISDSLRCTGLPDGDYESAGLPVTVNNGKATLRDGGSIAGSTITLMQGIRIAVSLGIPLAAAVTAATAHSARAIGMGGVIGSLAPGACADLVLLDSELQILKVYINGEEIDRPEAG